MTAPEIFARYSPGQASEVLGWLHDHNRPAYRACVGLLAQRRKLRPIFVERKPRDERHAWMASALAKPANADAASEILQAWLLGAHRAMVCQFLDDLKVPHDGEGLLESLPAEPSETALQTAIENLLAKHPALAVATYLELFRSMDIAEWPTLGRLVEKEERLWPAPTAA